MSTPSDPNAFQMGLMEHLRELRKRIIISGCLVLIGAIASYRYAGAIFGLLSEPYYTAFNAASLIGTSPAEAWILKLKVSIFAGIALTSPALFYQVWAFVAPGLYAQEKRFVVPFISASTLLFALGVLFCYAFVLPYTFSFFRAEFASIGVTPTIKIAESLSMTLTTMIGFGLVFELPLLTFFLARTGVIDHLFLLRWFRHAIVLIFVVAAVLTPPDVFTQLLMALPLLVLYGISIGIAWWVAPAEPTEISENSLSEPGKNVGPAK